MVRTTPEDDYDRKLLHDVKEHGWHLVGIDDEDEGPAYVFSVGIFHTLGHPEICMFGLSSTQTMGEIINGIGDLIKSGQPPLTTQRSLSKSNSRLDPRRNQMDQTSDRGRSNSHRSRMASSW